MSKYSQFDNESRKRGSKFGKFLANHRQEDQQYEVLKMPQPYTLSSPYNKILDFNTKAKIVCQKTDLSLFLDQCKVIFVGDVEVGKSALINRFISTSFNHRYKPTTDVDYQMKTFEILNIDYTVGFWDMSGEDEYKVLNQPYYANANGNNFL
jgi:predicted GTPase